MNDIYTARRVFYTCMTVYVMVYSAQCAPVTDGDGTAVADLNGQTLINIGIKLNKPMLQLLGMTIKRTEERVKGQMCTAWTDWSECNVIRVAEFGVKFRTRECGGNSTACETESEQRTEKVYSICVDGWPRECPDDYSVTAKGFCVKLYGDRKESQYDAEQQCQKDGGHLINIDSEDKYADVGHIMKGANAFVWKGGHRASVNSPWIYLSGGTSGFDFTWLYGGSNNPRCVVMNTYMGDLIRLPINCAAAYNYMCEI